MPRRPQRQRKPLSKQAKTFLHQKLYGKRLYPSPDPPSFEYNPWNNFTLTIGSSSDTIVKISQIFDILVKTLAGAKAEQLAVRIISIRVWGTKEGKPIHLSPYTDNSLGQGDFMDLTDLPSRMNYARVGFEWPVSFQTKVFNDFAQSDDVIFTVDVGSDAPWIAYLRLLWKSTNKPLSRTGLHWQIDE